MIFHVTGKWLNDLAAFIETPEKIKRMADYRVLYEDIIWHEEDSGRKLSSGLGFNASLLHFRT